MQHVPWREGLVSELRALGPDFEGRALAAAPAGANVVPAERFRVGPLLRDAIHNSGASLSHAVANEPGGTVKLTAAASRFVRHYVSSLTAAAVVALGRGVGLDLAAERCAMVVENGLPKRHLLPGSDEGIVICAERAGSWCASGASVSSVDELRQYVWERLYGRHLAPLLAGVGTETPATPRLLWSNAAEWVAYTVEMAAAKLGVDAAAPFVEEATAVLEAPVLPGVDGPNPLAGLIEWVPVNEPDFPLGKHTRHQCCVTYMLPARTGYLCGNCPFLPLDDRVALSREHRDSPSGGPAQQRSIEFGRQRFRLGI